MIDRPCPTCGGETGRQADERLQFTGLRICMDFLCPQQPFVYIASAREIEERGRKLGPLHESYLDSRAQT